jgi:hypothetical protein
MDARSRNTRRWERWLQFSRGELHDDFDNDDEDDNFEEATAEKWEQWLEVARVEFCHQLLPKLASQHLINVRALDVLALASNEDTCNLLEVAGVGVVKDTLNILWLDLDGLEISMDSLEELNMAITHEGLSRVFSSIATFFSHLTRIQNLQVNNCHTLALEFLPAFLLVMHNIKYLTIDFTAVEEEDDDEEEEDETILIASMALKTAILNHPSLQAVKMSQVRSQTIRSISAELATIPNLRTVVLNGDYGPHEHIIISSVEDAAAIESILSNKSLLCLALSYVHFANEEVLETICNVISRSQLSRLDTYNWQFPETMNAVVARALTACESLAELEVTNCTHQHNSLWNDLGAALTRASSTLEWLTVRSTGVENSSASDNLVEMLQYAHQWKITSLKLHVSGWTNEIDYALANYIKTTPCLQTLKLVLTRKPNVISPALVEAIRSGTRTLEHIKLQAIVRVCNGDPDFLLWRNQLDHQTTMNRLRRVYTEKFEAALAVKSCHFVDLMVNVKMSILF